jgi:hypothetical protein
MMMQNSLSCSHVSCNIRACLIVLGKVYNPASLDRRMCDVSVALRGTFEQPPYVLDSIFEFLQHQRSRRSPGDLPLYACIKFPKQQKCQLPA